MFQDKTRIFRSVTAMLLALIMILSTLPVLAETQPPVPAESQEEGTENWSLRPVSTNYNNAAAFNTYVNNVMYSKTVSAARANASSLLRGRLNKDEKILYDALLEKIQKVAAGKLASTSFTIKTFNPKFPASNSSSDISKKVSVMISNVINALLGDGPCEMFWYDIESNWNGNLRWKTVKGKHQITQVTINMYVAKEFSSSNSRWTTKFNKSKAKAVQTAAANAKKIVQKYRGKSDVEKLRAYKNEICRLNEYNQAAASDSSTPYGNPWQLVWVFDGDPKTNVVCEGYSKAFQYLCELSSFSGDVSVMSMTGVTILATEQYVSDPGRHMWNVVTMPDKKHYLVDVTNCDSNGPGEAGSDILFLTGCAATVDLNFTHLGYQYKKGYLYPFLSGSAIAYCFDTNINLYKDSDRNLSPKLFDALSDKTKARGTCGKDVEWSLNNGVLKIGGSGKMANYKSGSPAPWKQYASSIKKIVIGDSITEIGKYAFDGLKAATTVTIGEKVKKIGNYAFNGCKKLKTFTFKGDKLKTIGSNAFKGLPIKVTFTCTAKKLEAYKKLLLKKGAPKKATFKKK